MASYHTHARISAPSLRSRPRTNVSRLTSLDSRLSTLDSPRERSLDTWLAGNVPLGTAVALLVGIVLWANRAFLREIAGDADTAWRHLLRGAGVLVAALLAWTTVFDNWRQLIEEPLRLSKRYPSERIVLDPTPESLRA